MANTEQEDCSKQPVEKVDSELAGQNGADVLHVGDIIDIHTTREQEAKVLRKIDRVILPLMGFCYMLQYTDKVSLGYSTQLGLLDDLGLVGTQYSWTSSIFFFGYFFWSGPSSYLSVRFPLGKYLAVSVILWGAVLMCHAAVSNFRGLMVARFFLGLTEAAVAPGFSLITGMFYKRKEQPSRMGIWFIGNGVANTISGLIAYGIGRISSELASWRLLFIILGAVTCVYGFVLLMILPDSPIKAKFLNVEERVVALHRTLENKTGVMDEDTFKPHQILEALRDPQAWLLTLYQFTVNIPSGGIVSFSSIIVNGSGFSSLDSLLLQMPNGLFQLGGLAFISVMATRFSNARILLMVSMISLSLIGMIMVYVISNKYKYARLAGIWMSAIYACDFPMGFSLITSNVGGFTKKSTVSAMMVIGYCVGNLIGPQFFLAREAPRYPTGIRALLCGFALGMFFLFCLYVYYVCENLRRDKKYGPPGQTSRVTDSNVVEVLEHSDREITSFRYVI